MTAAEQIAISLYAHRAEFPELAHEFATPTDTLRVVQKDIFFHHYADYEGAVNYFNDLALMMLEEEQPEVGATYRASEAA